MRLQFKNFMEGVLQQDDLEAIGKVVGQAVGDNIGQHMGELGGKFDQFSQQYSRDASATRGLIRKSKEAESFPVMPTKGADLRQVEEGLEMLNNMISKEENALGNSRLYVATPGRKSTSGAATTNWTDIGLRGNSGDVGAAMAAMHYCYVAIRLQDGKKLIGQENVVTPINPAIYAQVETAITNTERKIAEWKIKLKSKIKKVSGTRGEIQDRAAQRGAIGRDIDASVQASLDAAAAPRPKDDDPIPLAGESFNHWLTRRTREIR